MIYTKDNTLSEIIKNNIRTALIMENYNLNYSTNGRDTLGKVCLEYGIQPAKILNELNKLNRREKEFFKINDWKADFLCDYIERNHHTYIRKTIPLLISSSKPLVKEKYLDETLTLLIQQLNTDFEIHMQKEEKLLFPYIKKLVKTGNENVKFETAPFGSVTNIIKVMEKEHSEAYKKLESIRLKSESSKTKRSNLDASTEFKKLLKEFESDFHIHIHIENYLLFPEAASLEKKLKKTRKKY